MSKLSRDVNMILDEENGRNNIRSNRKRKKKHSSKGKIAILTAEIIVILGLILTITFLLIPNAKAMLADTWLGKMFIKTIFSEDTYNKILDKDFDRTDTGINDDLDAMFLDGYLNIALFGLDSRFGELDAGVQSDTIIIVSIDKESKQMKMSSIYRDTYLRRANLDGSSTFAKINSAYTVGGAQAAVKTLNSNLDLNIKDYVTVNFNGIATIIDKLGGIDITITADEASYINGYLVETREVTGLDSPDVAVQSGPVHLNGLQATAYCRIRAVRIYLEDGTSLNDDFGRTARQRLILSKMVEKAKSAGKTEVLAMAEEIFESESDIFLTSLPYDEVIDLIPLLLTFTMGESKAFPAKYADYSAPVYGSSLLPDDLASMVIDLHEFLFDVKNYKPSKTVIGISESLCSKAGITPRYDSILNKIVD